MKIAFDDDIFVRQVFGGISKYFIELSSNIQLLGNDVKIYSPFHQNQYLKEKKDLLSSNYFFSEYIPSKTKSNYLFNNINRLGLPLWKPDIIHQTFYRSRFKINKPHIITIHDLIHEKFSSSSNRYENVIRLKLNAINSANRIICVSESTKNDLLNCYKLDPDRIDVVYHGVSKVDFTQLDEITINKYSFPFLLYVGNRGGYKNFKWMLSAISKSQKIREDFKLILFGGGVLTQSEIGEIEKLKLNFSNILHVEGEDSLLHFLYSKASALIYPSLYEGFGLPILEAMINNCPVICSNTSSIPEVAGNAAIYFNPRDENDFIEKCESSLYSSSVLSTKIALGCQQINKFSWDTCAKNTLDVYTSAMTAFNG
jgi:glycosyltransferase involved in cell wall biosynthesis